MEAATPESREHRVELRLVRDYEFAVTFKDGDFESMVCDEPPPLGEGSGPTAAALLSAAVGNCLAASFAFCLRKVRLEPVDLTARAVAHVARNEQGRFRVTSIDVTLAPQVREEDAARFERCEQLFENFCIVTESVRRGIPVNVTVATGVEAEPVKE